ncbi:MAG: hypothetical protein ACUVQ1_07715 [Candidatus Kapaibacteriales bacterium]
MLIEAHLGQNLRKLFQNSYPIYFINVSTKSEIRIKKRAKDVFSFYQDLFSSIQIISRKVKRNGFVCFVVGNRRIRGIELSADKISVDFFEHQGFEHKKTMIRAISNKRMPIENAPSNVKGEKDFTMRYILILKKLR